MTNTLKRADKLRAYFPLVSVCSLRTLQGTWVALASLWCVCVCVCVCVYEHYFVPNVHILIALRDPKATESSELSDVTCMRVKVLVT